MLKHDLVFLLGVPRSGTTLLSLLLGQHPSIYCPQEPWLLLGLDSLGESGPLHPADSTYLSAAVSDFLEEDRTSYLCEAAKAIYKMALGKSGKSVFVDKTPRYFLCPELLGKLLSDSCGIYLIRNPLDIAASYKTSWNINLSQIINEKIDSPVFLDYILGYERLSKIIARSNILVLKYESLVKNPESEMEKVFQFIGVDQWDISEIISPDEAGLNKRRFGDHKILESSTVHTKSLDTYKQVFSREEIVSLMSALGRAAFVKMGYQHVWEDACRTFSLEKIEDNSIELRSIAEKYLFNRKENCKKAGNDYYHLESIDQLSTQNAVLTQQVDQLSTQNAVLTQQVDQLSTQNADLKQQVNTFLNMNFKSRAVELISHVKHSAKQLIRKAIWRVVNGKAKAPLPRISLVTPVFNGESHIAETLESVLQQDYPDLEYIIVDGGSTDGTLDIIRLYQQRSDLPQRISLLISEPDQGMYDAIGKGFDHATGEVFCYLNADDLLECNGLISVGEYFASNPATQLIYHEDVVLTEGWKYPNVRQPENVNTVDLLGGHILFQDGVFWRRNLYEIVGGIRRDLKLAGDFDLWLRMSAHSRFVRRSGHVSCFRIRPGQLSTQMQKYFDEMQLSIQDFLSTSSAIRKFWWKVKKPLHQLKRKLLKKVQADRLFFPIDFVNMPPPLVSVPPNISSIPLSPIDKKPAESILFSTPDTRFGEKEINYVYYDKRHGIAITHPPICPDKLDGLYRKYYSTPPTEMVLPASTSPYREFNGRRVWEKILLRIPTEKLDRYLPNCWGDNTLDELMLVLKKSNIDTNKTLRFLDTGCFEGGLLDQIRDKTKWSAFGLEPNSNAVELALSKGHTVWKGYAEDGVESVPSGQQFDVIFMGQSIEHVDDPIRVLRRLRLLLAPGGVIVMSTPNLDSIEIDHFGPTWAHWHIPYHRYIFSREGLSSLITQVGLVPSTFQSFSHPYWTAISVAQNYLGLGGSTSHAVNFNSSFSLRAHRYQFWKMLLWNRLGKGDYFFIVAKDGVRE